MKSLSSMIAILGVLAIFVATPACSMKQEATEAEAPAAAEEVAAEAAAPAEAAEAVEAAAEAAAEAAQ